jgi:hypothetical protein
MMSMELDVQRQRQEELIREAEEARAASEVMADRKHPTLAWVGRRMVEMGSRLIRMSNDDQETAETWTIDPNRNLN